MNANQNLAPLQRNGDYMINSDRYSASLEDAYSAEVLNQHKTLRKLRYILESEGLVAFCKRILRTKV